MQRTVVFVCAHGANKSRLAAAYFARMALPGWRVATAGTAPQPAVSEHAVRLVAGTDVETLLDRTPPQAVADVPVDRDSIVVAIDCDVPGAVRWHLQHGEPGVPMRDELRRRAEALARQVADAGP